MTTELPEIASDGYDAIILGAGISGLVAAKILQEEGLRRILIVDEYDRPGGNHINCDFGPYTFDIGSIIFQDDSPLMKYFPELLDIYHPITCTISRVAPDHAVREYPLSMKDEVFFAGPGVLARTFGSIAWNRLRMRRQRNTDDFARFWIGSYLFDRSGLANYIVRFSGVSASELDMKFAESRMGWLREGGSVNRRLKALLSGSIRGAPNQSFVRPREGFAPLYAEVQATLERHGAHFALGRHTRGARRVEGGFQVDADGFSARGRRLISTIPVDRAYGLMGLPPLPPLPNGRLVSLFFSFSGDRGFASNLLYNFSKDGDWKRITMFSDFYGKADGREFLTVEIVAREGARRPPAEAAADFMADVSDKHLFNGDLRLEGFYELDYAYPMYVKSALERANEMIGAMKKLGVESAGRQGRFDYLPTARQVTLAVEDVMKRTSA